MKRTPHRSRRCVSRSGAAASASASSVALATSAGFSGAYRATGYSCSATMIAGKGAGMQRDYAYHGVRHYTQLDDPETQLMYRAMKIAAGICVYTNDHVSVEVLS